MGCGASKDPKVAVADSHRPVQNPNNRSNQKNGFRQVELKNNSQSNPVNEPKSSLVYCRNIFIIFLNFFLNHRGSLGICYLF